MALASNQEQTQDLSLQKQEMVSMNESLDPSALPRNFREMLFWSKQLSKTALGVTEIEAFTRQLIGRPYGMDPVSCCQNIYNIKGKYMFHYSVLLARAKRGGYRFKWIENSDTRACIEFFEKVGDEWESVGTSEFTLADAKKAGTQNMDKIPKTMLAARAVGNGVRTCCADAFNGMVPYAQGEIVEETESVQAASKSETLAAQMRAKAEAANIQDAEIVADEDGVVIEPQSPAQLSPEGAALERLAGEFGMTPNEIRDFQTFCESDTDDKTAWISRALNQSLTSKEELFTGVPKETLI